MWYEESFVCYECYVYNEEKWSGIDIYRNGIIDEDEWNDLCEEKRMSNILK